MGRRPRMDRRNGIVMDVLLKRHEGVKRVGGQLISVKHPQDLVYLDGKHIGYIGRRDNAKLALIYPLDEDLKAPVLRQIASIREAEGVFGPPAGAGNAPVPAERASAAWDQLDNHQEEEDTEYDDE